MYHHLAMKQPDREKFQEAVKKESKAHYKEGNYRLVKKSELPEEATLLSSVWKMKRKRKPYLVQQPVAKYVRLHEQYGTENKFLPRKEGNL
jgi:hypothetical protein